MPRRACAHTRAGCSGPLGSVERAVRDQLVGHFAHREHQLAGGHAGPGRLARRIAYRPSGRRAVLPAPGRRPARKERDPVGGGLRRQRRARLARWPRRSRSRPGGRRRVGCAASAPLRTRRPGAPTPTARPARRTTLPRPAAAPAARPRARSCRSRGDVGEQLVPVVGRAGRCESRRRPGRRVVRELRRPRVAPTPPNSARRAAVVGDHEHAAGIAGSGAAATDSRDELSRRWRPSPAGIRSDRRSNHRPSCPRSRS